jgi:hypothetical protein
VKTSHVLIPVSDPAPCIGDLLCSALGLPESALGSAQRSTGLVELTAALAADLASLSEALDESGTDLADALRQLVADVRLAVRSYLGLTIVAATFPLTLTAMEPFVHPGDVASSLLMPLSDGRGDDAGLRLAVILYAARPGAFVDLAADLCWLTGRQLSDFRIDQHLSPPEPDSHGGMQRSSLVNQAIGVLLGRGYTPEQAELEIDMRAAAAGHARAEAASIILAGLPSIRPDPAPDAAP